MHIKRFDARLRYWSGHVLRRAFDEGQWPN
jgi:hypothetical protein